MKLAKTTQTLAASALIAGISFAAPQDVASAEVMLHEAIINMEVLSSSGSVTGADLSGVSDLIGTYFDAERPVRPESHLLRAQLDTYVQELQTRARNAWIKQVHTAFLKEQIIESQLDVVLQELIFRARQNDWTPSHFQAVRAKLIARAENAVDDPSSAYLRNRFEELVGQATRRAQGTFADRLQQYRAEVIEFRLQNALAKVRSQRRAGDLSQVGFNSMVTLLHKQARAAAQG